MRQQIVRECVGPNRPMPGIQNKGRNGAAQQNGQGGAFGGRTPVLMDDPHDQLGEAG